MRPIVVAAETFVNKQLFLNKMLLQQKLGNYVKLYPNIRNSIRKFSDDCDYKLVYSFSFVRVGSAINKVKFKQAIVTAIAMPLSAGLEFSSFAPQGTTLACLAVGMALNVTVFGFGRLFTGVVGKVYLNEKEDIAKFAYVGASGQRLEIQVPREDVILPNIDSRPGFLYSKLQFSEDDLTLKLNEKYYDYCDKELARKIFGASFQCWERQ